MSTARQVTVPTTPVWLMPADFCTRFTAVNGAKHVVVLMEHVAKDGTPKNVTDCTLPLTGKGVAQRIITDSTSCS